MIHRLVRQTLEARADVSCTHHESGGRVCRAPRNDERLKTAQVRAALNRRTHSEPPHRCAPRTGRNRGTLGHVHRSEISPGDDRGCCTTTPEAPARHAPGRSGGEGSPVRRRDTPPAVRQAADERRPALRRAGRLPELPPPTGQSGAPPQRPAGERCPQAAPQQPPPPNSRGAKLTARQGNRTSCQHAQGHVGPICPDAFIFILGAFRPCLATGSVWRRRWDSLPLWLTQVTSQHLSFIKCSRSRVYPISPRPKAAGI